LFVVVDRSNECVFVEGAGFGYLQVGAEFTQIGAVVIFGVGVDWNEIGGDVYAANVNGWMFVFWDVRLLVDPGKRVRCR
jgi:hypothetical protein